MTSNPVSNSNAIRADSVEVWNPLKRKYQSIQESVVGLAPEDLNSIELLARAIGDDPAYFQTVAEGLAAKADAADVAADFATLAGVVDTKASSSSVATADAALQEQIDTKASQTQLDFVGQNFQPTVRAFAPLSIVPRSDPDGNPFAELSLDDTNFASQEGLLSLGATVEAVQATASSNAEAVAALTGSKQDTLIAGSPADGFPLLSSKNLRGLAATAPLTLANDGTHLTVGLS